MNYTLGIDFGGGASKATLLAEDGNVAATHTVEYPTYYPQAGWAQQNPLDWYSATCAAIGAILEKSGATRENILAVSLDAATHTAVLTDDNFHVLRDAIYWTDSRSIPQVRFLREHFSDTILAQVLHRPDTIWTLPQLMWVRENEPEVWQKTRRILFAKDFVRHRLTGDFVTDKIEAQGSMFFDSTRMDWSPELCGILDLDASRVLPMLVEPTDIVGSITSQAALETGLAEGTPVLCGTTDTVMEVLASGSVRLGQTTVKLATAGRICVMTDRAYPHPHLINYSHVVPGLWYPGTATKSCAASYRWFRDTLGAGSTYAELDAAAKLVAPTCDGLMFHPYLNGELTPYADPRLCGSFVGMRSGHTRGHFARAVLEGVALSMLDCRLTLENTGIPHDPEAVVIGGGAASPLWRQILADTLGITLIEKARTDSSLGSAMMAGVALGVFESYENAVETCTKIVSRTVPNPENTAKYAANFARYRAVHDALAPVYHGD